MLKKIWDIKLLLIPENKVLGSTTTSQTKRRLSCLKERLTWCQSLPFASASANQKRLQSLAVVTIISADETLSSPSVVQLTSPLIRTSHLTLRRPISVRTHRMFTSSNQYCHLPLWRHQTLSYAIKPNKPFNQGKPQQASSNNSHRSPNKEVIQPQVGGETETTRGAKVARSKTRKLRSAT